MKLRAAMGLFVLGLGVVACSWISPSSNDEAPTPMDTVTGITGAFPSPEPEFTSPPPPSVTPTLPPPTRLPSPTPTVQPEADSQADTASTYVYGIQPGSPLILQSWKHDCNWMGIGGQVFGPHGFPVGEIIVEVGGVLNGKPILGLSITGIDHGYGPGGYEIQLADQPTESFGEVWIQLKDNTGNAVSPIVYLETYDICIQNLILLNFVEESIPEARWVYYFPLIFK